MPEVRKQSGVYAALIAAGAMITHQVAGKAIRDALFLHAFGIGALPAMLIASAIFSVAAGLVFARTLRSWEPRRAVPVAFLISAAMMVAEWLLSYVSLRGAAVAVYLHMAAVGSALISGFWSVLNEKFDPHSARREFARIATGGTLGGLVGGVLASVLPWFAATTAILPVLSALHLLCAYITWSLPGLIDDTRTVRVKNESNGLRTGYDAFRRSEYLRQIAALVFLGTVSAALLDYVFKAHAAATYRSSEDLVQFFALFYAGTGLLTFVIQTTLGRISLERFGLIRTLAMLPFGVVTGAIGALLAPGLSSSAAVRAGEAILRSSLYRSGYELLYTPVPQGQKRLAKPIIDVVFERIGDVAGGLLINLLLFWKSPAVLYVMTALTIGFAIVELVVTARLNRGYVTALENSLINRAVELDADSVRDRTTRDTLMRTLASVRPKQVQSSENLPTLAGPRLDPVVQRLLDLRSGEAARVRKALKSGASLDDLLVPQVIRLLAWDEVSEDAIQLLRQRVSEITGQLVDALTDFSQEFAVRRRVPRVLSTCPTQRAADGLVQGLSDRRFEVRFQCGRALAHLRDVKPQLVFDSSLIFDLIVRDIAIDRNVLLRQNLEHDDQSAGDPQMAHTFRLLGLVLPSEPVRLAYQGLYANDPTLWGTSMEYLETVLPERVRNALWPVLKQDAALRSL